MKKLFLFVLLSSLLHGQAAFDISLQQVNSGGSSFGEVLVHPSTSGLLGFTSGKVAVNVPTGAGVQTLLAAVPSGTGSLVGTASPTFTGTVTGATFAASVAFKANGGGQGADSTALLGSKIDTGHLIGLAVSQTLADATTINGWFHVTNNGIAGKGNWDSNPGSPTYPFFSLEADSSLAFEYRMTIQNTIGLLWARSANHAVTPIDAALAGDRNVIIQAGKDIGGGDNVGRITFNATNGTYIQSGDGLNTNYASFTPALVQIYVGTGTKNFYMDDTGGAGPIRFLSGGAYGMQVLANAGQTLELGAGSPGITISPTTLNVAFASTTAATSATAASVKLAGGLGVTGKIFSTSTVQNPSGIADTAGTTAVLWSGTEVDIYNSGTLGARVNAGNILLPVVGTTLTVKSGANGLSGTVTLTAGAATITSTAIDINTAILFSIKTPGGTPGLYQPLAAVSAGSAAVTSIATDTSTYNWIAFKLN